MPVLKIIPFHMSMIKKIAFEIANLWLVQAIFGKGGCRDALHSGQREQELERVCLRKFNATFC